jgi:16S rRNA (guanine527-N7)-methyltransferase
MSGTVPGLLREGLEQLKIPFTEAQLIKAQVFLEELERWNRRYGFIARSDPGSRRIDRRRLVIRHVLDSLAAWGTIRVFQHRNQIGDVGSGAGFPGIPLALFLPDSSFILLEPSAKKSAFLRNAVILTGLRNVEVLETRLEDVDRRFDLVVLRAFSPLSRASLAELQRVLEPNGAIVAYKGKRARIEEELAACGLDAENHDIVAVAVPFLDEERHLVIVPKELSAS